MNKRKVSYFLIYTAGFLLFAFLIFYGYLEGGFSFIKASDGWKQHFKALLYYSQWLRGIAKSILINHKLSMPEWSFSIGYGSDIITTLHYYVVGDPLNLFSVFVRGKYMPYFYSALVIVRLYLAGISFAFYCHERGHDENTAVLAGSWLYAFSAFALYAVIKHPYFVNPMIYLPLVFAGIEKIIKKKRPYLFIFSIFLSAVSNFYFFYMIVLLTVLYVAFRLLTVYHGFHKEMWNMLLYLILCAGCGVLLSAVLFFPVIRYVLASGRGGDGYALAKIYNLNMYKNLPANFLSYGDAGEWTVLGFSALAILAVLFLFFCCRKYQSLKIGFCLLTVFILIPFFGYVINGFAYACNRWSFAYTGMLSYIVVAVWKDLMEISKKKGIFLLVLLGIYGTICVMASEVNIETAFIQLALAAFIVLIILFMQKINVKKVILESSVIILACAGFLTVYYGYSSKEEKYPKGYVKYEKVEKKLHKAPDYAVLKAEKENEGSSAFYRFSGNNLETNSTLISGGHNTQYYWSVPNGNITKYFKGLGVNEPLSHHYNALDGRTILNELASVKYYVTDKEKGTILPFGYRFIGKYKVNKKNYYVYQNNYALPLVYSYQNYIEKEEYDSLNPVQKQESLLQGIVLEKEKGEQISDFSKIVTKDQSLKLNSQLMDYKVESGADGVKIEGNAFIVSKENASVTFFFNGLKESETYFNIEGLDYIKKKDQIEEKSETNHEEKGKRKKKERMTYIGLSSETEDGERANNKIHYFTPQYVRYSGWKDYTVNLGYSDTEKKSITLTFKKAGDYRFDKIQIICQPMKQYKEQISAMKDNVTSDLQIADNKVSGNVSMKKAGILCFSIPYSDGWKAYVDGNEQKLTEANIMYMAVPLSKGKHKIELRYETPGMKTGALLSFFGVILLVIIMKKEKTHDRRQASHRRRRRKRLNKEKHGV